MKPGDLDLPLNLFIMGSKKTTEVFAAPSPRSNVHLPSHRPQEIGLSHFHPTGLVVQTQVFTENHSGCPSWLQPGRTQNLSFQSALFSYVLGSSTRVK